jgi:hypothetical protein
MCVVFCEYTANYGGVGQRYDRRWCTSRVKTPPKLGRRKFSLNRLFNPSNSIVRCANKTGNRIKDEGSVRTYAIQFKVATTNDSLSPSYTSLSLGGPANLSQVTVFLRFFCFLEMKIRRYTLCKQRLRLCTTFAFSSSTYRRNWCGGSWKCDRRQGKWEGGRYIFDA